MLTGATPAPIPPATLLTLTPNQPPSITSGQVQSFTLTAADTNGVALQNQLITLTVNGINQQTETLTTDGTGHVEFAYAGSPQVTGADQVQANTFVNGTLAYSNVVTVPWNSGTNQPPAVNAGTPQAIVLPAPAILNGTVTNDGLPSNTLTITWTTLSGPGAVTFDNANQASTAATFSAQGTYVLQLSASDGALTANSTVTITVQSNPNWTSGWIQSPADKSTVSGLVPRI